jgi:hypothetical protein
MGITTTHDPRGGGQARLIFALGGRAQADISQREFELLKGVTANYREEFADHGGHTAAGRAADGTDPGEYY